jgi:hypothetical protein
MARKNKDTVDLKLRAAPAQDWAEEKSEHQIPSHEEIRHRAYELYLGRGDRPGDELDDWLRAERELQKVALFRRGWSRLEARGRTKCEEGN